MKLTKGEEIMLKIILLCIYFVLTLSGLVLMKKGGNPGTFKFDKKEIKSSMSFISALGFLCYLCSFLIFTKIVVLFDLSYIMPIVTGVVQIATLIVANIFFKEKFSKKAIIGAGLVIIGIFIMNF